MINLKDFVKVRVEQLYNKNQFVIYYNDNERNRHIVCFQSYDTLIAILEGGKLYISWQYWDYSKTKLKHLKLFVNEYTPFVYETKHQFLNLIRSNERIETFEE